MTPEESAQIKQQNSEVISSMLDSAFQAGAEAMRAMLLEVLVDDRNSRPLSSGIRDVVQDVIDSLMYLPIPPRTKN